MSTDEFEFVVQGMYTDFYGWEDLTSHDNRADAVDERDTYNANEPDVPHRVIRRRVSA